jgi:hypothetical protein
MAVAALLIGLTPVSLVKFLNHSITHLFDQFSLSIFIAHYFWAYYRVA